MAKSQTRIEALPDDAPPSEDKGAKKSSAKRRPSSSQRQENELRDRLADCFDRIAETLATRGDDELAGIVREDAEVMASGLVFMTRPIAVLRLPLLFAVAVVEPMLAFGRILRVLLGRYGERRVRAQAEYEIAREQAEAEAEAAAVQ